jgi:hypothetical protein
MSNQIIYAGMKVTASLLASVAPLGAVKQSDESVTSSTTPQNDDTLQIAVAANGIYKVECSIKYDAASGGDLKYQWAVPSGASFDWNDNPRLTAGAAALSTPFAALTASSQSFAPGNGSGSNQWAECKGTLIVGNTAGTLILQWAQNTSSGTPTRVRSGSALYLWQVQ